MSPISKQGAERKVFHRPDWDFSSFSGHMVSWGSFFDNGDFDFNVLPDDVDTNMWNTLKTLLERTQTMVYIASDINPMIFSPFHQ